MTSSFNSQDQMDLIYFKDKYGLNQSDFLNTASTNNTEIKLSVHTKDELTPSHYDFAIQPVDYITQNDLGFCEGNVIKYISRWRRKNGREDLQKAMHYIQILIDNLDKGGVDSYNNTDQLD